MIKHEDEMMKGHFGGFRSEEIKAARAFFSAKKTYDK